MIYSIISSGESGGSAGGVTLDTSPAMSVDVNLEAGDKSPQNSCGEDFIPLPATPLSGYASAISVDEHEQRVLIHKALERDLRGIMNRPIMTSVSPATSRLSFASTSTPKRWGARENARVSKVEKALRAIETPNSSYAGDCSSSVTVTTPKSPGAIMRQKDSVRWCVFNTENTTRAQFWHFLHTRLSETVVSGITRVTKIRQRNARFRIDFWALREVSEALKNKLYMTARNRRDGVTVDLSAPLCALKGIWLPNSERRLYTRNWRLKEWKSFAQRSPAKKLAHAFENRTAVATWNANGLKNRMDELEILLDSCEIGVFALQETLIDDVTRKLIVRDYAVYTCPSGPEFRGQAILVHKSLMSYQVGPAGENFILHIKVNGLPGNKPWHFLSVYMPSGGKFRKQRTEYWKLLLEEYNSIITKDKAAYVVILGDMNENRSRVAKRMKSKRTGLYLVELPTGGFSFQRKGGKPSDIDHIIANTYAYDRLMGGRVERVIPTTSDHKPVVAGVRVEDSERWEVCTRHTPTRFNTKALRNSAKNFVCHNKWAPLAQKEIETEEDLELAAIHFSATAVDVGIELGVASPPRTKSGFLSRKTKRQLETARRLLKDREDKRRLGVRNLEYLDVAYKKAKEASRVLLKAEREKATRKEIVMATDYVRSGNYGAFHKWNARFTKTGKAAEPLRPVLKTDGTLATSRQAIVKRFGEYFKDLLQDDPGNLSSNRDYWKGKAHTYRETPLEGTEEAFTWKQCLIAIRHMAVGTASGHESVPPEVFKELLNIEIVCNELNGSLREWLDGVNMAPPEELLPTEPRTNMGVALWKIVQASWAKERPPSFWNKVMMTALHKSGDVADLKNYRGISLIALGLKIMTVMLAKKLEHGLEAAGIICKEQAGFRSREEAIGQFIAFSEIIKRRRLAGKDTYVAFIDLQKAFDKVMHEALFEVLEAAGVRGKMLGLIKNLYKTSEFCVKVDGEKTLFFQLLRGTRQGCPLSPILFILFMNELVHHVGRGVQVPVNAKAKGNSRVKLFCQQLLFADDIAGFGDSERDMQDFLTGVKEWSDKWHMPVGIKKCNVLLVTDSEAKQTEFANKMFWCGTERVETARKYKYLGIVVTDKHGDAEKSDEKAHAAVLAERVRRATHAYRSFLRDDRYPLFLRVTVLNQKIIPLGLYGGEWLGLRKDLCDKVQQAVNEAGKLCLNLSTKANIIGDMALQYELGIEPMYTRMSAARLRLWEKAGSLKTWLKDLVTVPHTMRGGFTWVQTTSKRAREYSHSKATYERSEAYSLYHMEGKLGPNGPGVVPPIPKDVTTIMRLIQLDGSLTSRSGEAKSNQWYFNCGFSYSRKVLETALIDPGLSRGLTWLTKLRLSGWHSAYRRLNALKHMNVATHLVEGTCPACGNGLGRADEVQHILLHCPKYTNARGLIAKNIELISKLIASGGGAFESLDKDKEAVRDAEVTLWLLGGYIPNHRRGEGMMVNPWVKNGVVCRVRESWPANSEGLQLYHVNWGGRTKTMRVQGELLQGYGYERVAEYLRTVMPNYMRAVFKEKPLRSHGAYSSTDDDMSLWGTGDEVTPSSKLAHAAGTPATVRLGRQVKSLQVSPASVESSRESTPCPPERKLRANPPKGTQADASSMASYLPGQMAR